MFADALNFLLEEQEPPNWARLSEHLPYEWIEQAELPIQAAPVSGIDGFQPNKWDGW